MPIEDVVSLEMENEPSFEEKQDARCWEHEIFKDLIVEVGVVDFFLEKWLFHLTSV